MQIMKTSFNSISAFCLLSVFITLFASSANAVEPSDKEKNEIAIICEDLLAGYAIYRDRLDAEGYSNTFAEDGVALLGSNTFTGRDALRKYITEHNNHNTHMIMYTDHDITVISDTEAVGVSTAVVLGGDRIVGPGDDPIYMDRVTAANEYHSKFKLTDEGWKLAHIEFDRIYQRED